MMTERNYWKHLLTYKSFFDHEKVTWPDVKVKSYKLCDSLFLVHEAEHQLSCSTEQRH